jgi:divalent metal cation (Fe/Co/Zn/Cd) transporter
MLAVGLIVIAIGGTILYLAINKIQDNEIKAKEREEREKIFR